jgi:hypothetical protein
MVNKMTVTQFFRELSVPGMLLRAQVPPSEYVLNLNCRAPTHRQTVHRRYEETFGRALPNQVFYEKGYPSSQRGFILEQYVHRKWCFWVNC